MGEILYQADSLNPETPLYNMPLLITETDEKPSLFDILAVRSADGTYYEAADPGYKSRFGRDLEIALSLAGDLPRLKEQTEYAVKIHGKRLDPMTGEEPFKIYHQLPSVVIASGLSTTFNACDTTAEVLRSIAALSERGDNDLLESFKQYEIPGMIGYIEHHVNHGGLFIEDPSFSGALGEDGRERHFALKVTYWKDSELNREMQREPCYPIVYTLAHFQNAEALQRIGAVLKNERLVRFGRYMKEAGIAQLMRNDHFVSAIDQAGVVDAPSSDSLTALLYLSPEELPKGFAAKVENYMTRLETEAGYRAGIPVGPHIDPYHMMVWTHEQALMNLAARRHHLKRAEEVTRRIIPYLDPREDLFPEYVNPETLAVGGNAKQLWAIGCYYYMNNPGNSLYFAGDYDQLYF